ncbi:MAG: YkgJ family cysteine cluster protein [Gemmatimonadetes bacterium]|nr:YkgJ family cysteine cluster protein [Gemmatimonadota bacterium]
MVLEALGVRTAAARVYRDGMFLDWITWSSLGWRYLELLQAKGRLPACQYVACDGDGTRCSAPTGLSRRRFAWRPGPAPDWRLAKAAGWSRLPGLFVLGQQMHADQDVKVFATVKLAIGEHELTIDMHLPARPTRPGELLPLYRGLAEHLMQASVDQLEDGRTVSCSKGCGACCRQIVPISALEARHLAQLIDELPAPRRAVIRERFAAARQRLEAAGLLPQLQDTSLIAAADAVDFGLRYFAVGVPCPFLEAEACSIYEERPIICRQYLVTSPPACCAHPTRETIAPVPVIGSVAAALRALSAPPGATNSAWVPMVLAPEWAADHPEPPPVRTGRELTDELFRHLASLRVLDPSGPQ